MTISSPEPQPQQVNAQGEEYRKRSSPMNKQRHNNNNKRNYQYYNPRYYNSESLPAYPMPYIYYPPPSVYYPTTTSNTITREDDDLEIIMHDENTSSVEMSKRSDSSKPLDLKTQLEYYFSRQNLVNDTFLVSQMDADLYVPISVIANFRRVREWTTDLDVIIKTLKEIESVTVSGTKVKPNISVERKTVIWRDVPECTEDEIRQLLKELDSPPVKELKQDIGNMWYFTFETEEEAIKLLLSVRGKSFKDQAIAARMKSEPVLRVNTPAAAAVTSNHVLPNNNNSLNSTTPLPIYPPYGYYYPNTNTTSNNLYPRRGYQNNSSRPPNYKSNYYQHQQRYDANHQVNSSSSSSSSRSPRGITPGKSNNKYANNSKTTTTTERWFPSELSSTDAPLADDMTNMTINENKQHYQQPRHHNNKYNYYNNNNNNNNKNYNTSNHTRRNYQQQPEPQVGGGGKEVIVAAVTTPPVTHDQQQGQNTSRNVKTDNNKSNNKKKGYNNNNNNNTNKGKKKNVGSSKSNSSTTSDSTMKKNSGEDLKPFNFPPLPGTPIEAAVSTAVDQPKKSIAEIVKASSPKKEFVQEEKPMVAPPLETNDNATKQATFSYADMLKKKEKEQQQKQLT